MSTSIGQRIKALREARGWSQEDLATRAGVSRGAISQWETSPTQRILAPHLAATAKALQVTADELLTGNPGHVGDDLGEYVASQVPDLLTTAWPHLTAAQRDALARQAADYAAANSEVLRELAR